MIILHFKASAMIGQFDSDGSGSLDRQEFLTLMINKVSGGELYDDDQSDQMRVKWGRSLQ